jgi:hypothetical protein
MLACCCLPILPENRVDCSLEITAAMDEGIDSCSMRVKRKIRNLIFSRIQFHFKDAQMLASARQRKPIEEVRAAYKGEKHAGGEVMPTVREHSWEEIFSQQRDAAEERSVDADEDDAA